MKKILTVSAISVGILLGLAGCSTVDRLILRPKLVTNTVPAQVVTLYVTNTVPLLLTNTIVTVDKQVVTNVAVVTNTVIQPVYLTNPPITLVLTNGFEVAPSVQTSANVVGAVSSVAVPGFGGLISNGLLALAGVYAAVRGSKYQKASEIATSGATALVKAIEQTRIGLNTLPADKAVIGKVVDDHLIDQIEAAVGKTGDVATFISQLVEQHTADTKAPTLAQKVANPQA